MDELRRALELCVAGDLLLQPVFDGLHVVVGLRFDHLHALGIGLRERFGDDEQLGARRGAERTDALDVRVIRERDEPRDLDRDAVAHEAEFAEIAPQRRELTGIAAVERRQGSERCDGSRLHAGISSRQ